MTFDLSVKEATTSLRKVQKQRYTEKIQFDAEECIEPTDARKSKQAYLRLEVNNFPSVYNQDKLERSLRKGTTLVLSFFTHRIRLFKMLREIAGHIYLVSTLTLLAFMAAPLRSEKIVLLPFPWPSHYTQLEKIGIELKNRNHDVIIITPSTETYHSESALTKIEYKIPGLSRNTFVSIAERRLETGAGFGLNWLVEYVKLLDAFGRALLEDRVIRKAVKNADLVISDTAFIVAPIFADYYNLPLIFLSPFGHLPGCMSETFGNIENPSIVPTFVATALFENIGLPQKMTFLQRNFNLISNVISKILRDTITVPILHPLTKRYSNKTLLQLWERVSLVLIPMDYSIEYPRPDLPFVKMIGPLTPSDSQKSLQTPFDKIFTESSNEVIVVSFGITNRLNTHDTVRILEGLMATGYTIIWKYDRRKLAQMVQEHGSISNQTRMEEGTVLCEKDEQKCRLYGSRSDSRMLTNCSITNCKRQAGSLKIASSVYVFDWLPQQQLLRESKTKLLITHCGLNSLYEALYHNTQVLCVPLFGEQFDNAGRVVSRKLGQALTIQELNKNSLEKAIYELTAVKTYAQNVEKVSRRLRRAKKRPVETAADWVEFVLAEKGDTSFLKPLTLPYHQYFLLDIILFWTIIIITVCIGLHKITKFDYETVLR